MDFLNSTTVRSLSPCAEPIDNAHFGTDRDGIGTKMLDAIARWQAPIKSYQASSRSSNSVHFGNPQGGTKVFNSQKSRVDSYGKACRVVSQERQEHFVPPQAIYGIRDTREWDRNSKVSWPDLRTESLVGILDFRSRLRLAIQGADAELIVSGATLVESNVVEIHDIGKRFGGQYDHAFIFRLTGRILFAAPAEIALGGERFSTMELQIGFMRHTMEPAVYFSQAEKGRFNGMDLPRGAHVLASLSAVIDIRGNRPWCEGGAYRLYHTVSGAVQAVQ